MVEWKLNKYNEYVGEVKSRNKSISLYVDHYGKYRGVDPVESTPLKEALIFTGKEDTEDKAKLKATELALNYVGLKVNKSNLNKKAKGYVGAPKPEDIESED